MTGQWVPLTYNFGDSIGSAFVTITEDGLVAEVTINEIQAGREVLDAIADTGVTSMSFHEPRPYTWLDIIKIVLTRRWAKASNHRSDQA